MPGPTQDWNRQLCILELYIDRLQRAVAGQWWLGWVQQLIEQVGSGPVRRSTDDGRTGIE
jgi:hypothetical protein